MCCICDGRWYTIKAFPISVNHIASVPLIHSQLVPTVATFWFSVPGDTSQHCVHGCIYPWRRVLPHSPLSSPTSPAAPKKKNNNIGSTYGISPYIYYKNQLNAGKYAIHWYYGTGCFSKNMSYILFVSQFSKNKQMASFGASYILHTTS